MIHELNPQGLRPDLGETFPRFTKFHANGNDFIIFALPKEDYALIDEIAAQALNLCHRGFGVGADGIIVLGNGLDISMTVINADGSMAKNCGNGLRCAAALIFKKNQHLSSARIKLDGRIYDCAKSLDEIAVSMGACSVKLLGEHRFSRVGIVAEMAQCHIGNDHRIYFFKEPVAECDGIMEEISGGGDEGGFNLGLLYRDHEGKIISRVYERGVGWTLACGTGASAAAAYLAFRSGELGHQVITIHQPGGKIAIELANGRRQREFAIFDVVQSGFATHVFSGICETMSNC